MSEIAILIRTYNEETFLPYTLEALLAQTEKAFDVILVDSGSTDSTLAIAGTYEDIKIIEIPKQEFTYGRALNIGIAAVVDRAKYIAMLSAHAIPCNENWLSELLVPVREHSRVVAVYGKQIPFPGHLNNPIVRALACEAYPKCYGDKPFRTSESYFFSNVNSLITIDSWLKNKFDESLVACEDWQWAKMAVDCGGVIAYQPGAAVYHSHLDSYASYFTRLRREAMGARKIDPISHPPLRRQECWHLVKYAFLDYLRRSKQRRSLVDIHWDIFRYKVVATLATYKGRKDARV
ncbi:MAG: glycosyltransferase family 2 protein [Deltaproteobacteria bacterium]|nr:glycosyltransferase family 2 protein [Deltaproteobacteria bacterium]MBW2071173.1 glycosyltransferase family 2 protein [Deltaproteobacteria bacterium]